jgi:hypothetical protein
MSLPSLCDVPRLQSNFRQGTPLQASRMSWGINPMGYDDDHRREHRWPAHMT